MFPERRGGERQRLVMRIAKVCCASGEYACIMQDISRSGVRLRFFHGHPPDSHMFLDIGNDSVIAVERRWIDGDQAGFRFSSPVDIDDFLQEQYPLGRRPLRLSIQHPVTLQLDGERSHAVLVNLSAQGACIEAGRKIPVGYAMRVEVGGMAGRFAHVCWRKQYRHGLVFQEALSLRDFACLALELQPFGSAAAVDTRDIPQGNELCA